MCQGTDARRSPDALLRSPARTGSHQRQLLQLKPAAQCPDFQRTSSRPQQPRLVSARLFQGAAELQSRERCGTAAGTSHDPLCPRPGLPSPQLAARPLPVRDVLLQRDRISTWSPGKPLGCDSPNMIVGASPSASASPAIRPICRPSTRTTRTTSTSATGWTPIPARRKRLPAVRVDGPRCRCRRAIGSSYQYQLSLNGKGNTVEIWQNTVASDIHFPHFQDDAEVKLYSAPSGRWRARCPPARASTVTPTGSSTSPSRSQTMIANGAISSAADLGQSFFFPATSTNPQQLQQELPQLPLPAVHGAGDPEDGRTRGSARERGDAGHLHDRCAEARWARRSAW